MKQILRNDIMDMLKDFDSVYSPVILFAYNRVDKLMNCLKHLEKCEGASETKLFIFSDGPKENSIEGVSAVRRFLADYSLKSVFFEVQIVEREKNWGLAASIIDGVTTIINKYGRAIIVEDDLIVEPSFLSFLNGALEFYKDKSQYGSVSAFTYPILALDKYEGDFFVTRKAECWGWGTWADRWENAKWADIDFDAYFTNKKIRRQFEKLEAGLDRLMYHQGHGKINSWAIRWVYYLFEKDKLTIYPSRSLVRNEGFDGSGTHCDGKFDVNGDVDCFTNKKTPALIEWKELGVNKYLEKEYAKYPRGNIIIYLALRERNILRK